MTATMTDQERRAALGEQLDRMRAAVARLERAVDRLAGKERSQTD